MLKNIYLPIESAVLFILIPVLIALDIINLPLFSILWIGAAFALLMLHLDKSFDKKQLWNFKKTNFKAIGIRFFVSALFLTLITLLIEPNSFLQFVKSNTLFWAIIMIGYPLLSVYPQEIIYRAFFTHRYSKFIKNKYFFIFLSALAFALAHIMFNNYIAITLSFLGGLIFAYNYLKTKSLFSSSLEHALYGDFIFTIGIGRYFVASFM